MQALSSTLRNQLERTVIAARDVAEEGAWAALERLAVNKVEPLSHMTAEQRELRVKLRAKGRQLGDVREKNGEQDIYYLHQECAYEVWHQMLFARFLAENQLLMHPDGVAVSLEECEELAAEEGTDGWTLAARYASRMLPQIFRPDDPLLAVTFAPEDKQALEKLLAGLPVEVFTADDSLGWVYQFWQTKRKKEVNDSGEKIGADELPAVTQLFTEDYMVKFLLHNTLGAWWAGKRLTTEDAEGADSEEDLRQKVALPGVDWEYLRFVRGDDGESGPWRPAAGTFDDWPAQAAELKILDPCCGSGHFLVAAFDLMVRIRTEEEGLTAAEASDAVLRDNLFGLEIDPRCTQIAAFALAFAAWSFTDAGGYRVLPELHIACTGIGPQATEEQWIKLAEQSGVPMPRGGQEPIRNGLVNLHSLFSQAPILGSLIEPNELLGDLIAADYETLLPFLTVALAAEHVDDDTHQRAVAAAGMAKAAELLARNYSLVITNVPYLGRPDQAPSLKAFCDEYHADAKTDLATVFLERCLDFCTEGASAGLVLPQSWLFQPRYKKLRKRILRSYSLDSLSPLGPRAFETISGERVNVCLCSLSCHTPLPGHSIVGVDASGEPNPVAKSAALLKESIGSVAQSDQESNPDSRIMLIDLSIHELLSEHATCIQGLATSDDPQFTCCFWELPFMSNGWLGLDGTVQETVHYGGRERLLHWEYGQGRYYRHAQRLKAEGRLGGWKSGTEARGKMGVLVSQMSSMPVTVYTGEFYDHNASVIIVNDPDQLPAVWCYASNPEFAKEVRKLDQSLKPSNKVFVQVPFDTEKWKAAAALHYPDGLPGPESDDPIQWLFHGWPEESTAPLQAAVARLLGYRWPAELDEEMRLSERARALVNPSSTLVCTKPLVLPGGRWDFFTTSWIQLLVGEADGARGGPAGWLGDRWDGKCSGGGFRHSFGGLEGQRRPD